MLCPDYRVPKYIRDEVLYNMILLNHIAYALYGLESLSCNSKVKYVALNKRESYSLQYI